MHVGELHLGAEHLEWKKIADTTYIRPEKPNNSQKKILMLSCKTGGKTNICDLLLNCIFVAWCQHLLTHTHAQVIHTQGKYGM